MAMIGSFYAPEQWVQPNQRNIGDSLLDLYKMKLAREEASRQREESKMNMELKRLDMQKKLEEEKRQKEFTKQAGNFVNQYQKSQNLPEKVKAPAAPNLAALFAGGAMPNPAGASMQGVMNRAMQGSFPQQFATPRMGAEELQRSLAMKALEFGDPEKAAAALKLLNPTQQGLNVEDQIRLAETKSRLKRADTTALYKEKENLLNIENTIKKQMATMDQTSDLYKLYMDHLYKLNEQRADVDNEILTRNATRDRGLVYHGDKAFYQRFNPQTGQVELIPAMVGAAAPAAPAGAIMPNLPPDAQRVLDQSGASGTGAWTQDQVNAMAANPQLKIASSAEPLTGGTEVPKIPGVASESAALEGLKPGEQFRRDPVVKGSKTLPEKIAAVQQKFRNTREEKALGKSLQAMYTVNRTMADIEANPNDAVAQLQMLWTAIKSLDESVVKESETKFFLVGQGMREQMDVWLSYVTANPGEAKTLAPKYARQLAETVRRNYAANLGVYDAERRRYLNQNSALLKSYNIENPDEVLPPLPPEYGAAFNGVILNIPGQEGTPTAPTSVPPDATSLIKRDGKVVAYRDKAGVRHDLTGGTK